MHGRGQVAQHQSPFRVVLYSHDSVGLGHVRRNLALAHSLAHRLPALTGRPVTGLLLSSLSVPAHQLPPGFDLVAVPSVGKTDGAYHPRHLGVEMGEVVQLRAEILRAAVLGFGPDLIVVDRHVHGLGGELDATLTAVRTRRPQTQIVLGLRDVLDDPDATAGEWNRLDMSVVRQQFDAIWVYGDPSVHDLRTTGELPAELTDLVRFTGYLSRGRESFSDGEHSRPYVLTMVGGGSDGLALCRAAAQAQVPAGHRHVVVTGPQMCDQDYDEVRFHAGPDVQVMRTVSDGVGSIRGAAALVSMAGYNTVAEVMSYPVPALLVPREEPRREQLIRARALARAGVVDVFRAGHLQPYDLGRWLAAAVTRRVDRSAVALDGLANVGGLAADLLGGVPRSANPAGPMRALSPALTGVRDVAV